MPEKFFAAGAPQLVQGAVSVEAVSSCSLLPAEVKSELVVCSWGLVHLWEGRILKNISAEFLLILGEGRDDGTKNGRVWSLFSEEPLLVGLLLSICKWNKQVIYARRTFPISSDMLPGIGQLLS